LKLQLNSLRHTTRILSLAPLALHIMHDAYTKMSFPPHTLDPDQILTFFFTNSQKGEKKENKRAQHVLPQYPFPSCPFHHGDFHRIHQINLFAPKVGNLPPSHFPLFQERTRFPLILTTPCLNVITIYFFPPCLRSERCAHAGELICEPISATTDARAID